MRASLATIVSSHGRSGSPSRKPGERAPRLDEPVLGGLLGFGGVLGDQHGGPEGDVLVRADERRVCVAIPVRARAISSPSVSARATNPHYSAGAKRFHHADASATAEGRITYCTDQAEPSEALRITSEEINAVLAATMPGEAS